METMYSWNEDKRQANVRKHGLDFLRAGLVLESPYRVDVVSDRAGEHRIQSFAYVLEVLTVLTVVHLPSDPPRIISFRRANRREREAYHAWLEAENDDT